MQDIIHQSLRPGDMIAIGLIGNAASTSILPATRIDVTVSAPSPLPPPTLTPWPTFALTPTPTPLPPKKDYIPSVVVKATTISQDIATKNAKNLATYSPTSTAIAVQQTNEYNCSLWQRELEIQEKQRRSSAIQKEEFDNKLKIIESALQSLPTQHTLTTDIYSAFYSASEFFDKARLDGRYNRLTLIVFSDMEHTVATIGPTALAIQAVNLERVEALIAMIPYSEGDIQKYYHRKNIWQEWFTVNARAKKVHFFPLQLSTSEQILSVLGRNP